MCSCTHLRSVCTKFCGIQPSEAVAGVGGHAPHFTLDRKWQGLRLGRLCGPGASALTRRPGRHWEWPGGGELGARRWVCLLGSVWVGESLGPYVLLLWWPRLGRGQCGLARSFLVVMPGECILGTRGSPTRCESCQEPWARSVPLGPPSPCWSPLKASLTEETRSPWCSGLLRGGARPAPRRAGSSPALVRPGIWLVLIPCFRVFPKFEPIFSPLTLRRN